ncbi:MAG: hypothetical protein K6U74_15570, partial [Firmicutes bacterium]|nr:hypothetical protein [Bacillota bacterium]
MISGYTLETCEELLHAEDSTVSTTSTEYIEVKSYSFTLAEDDYRRELRIEADISGSFSFLFLFFRFYWSGFLRVDLVKPDGTREAIFEAAKPGEGFQTFSGTRSLDGLAPGTYRVAVMIKSGRSIFGLASASNRVFKVFLSSKRVYRSPSVWQSVPLQVEFDIEKISLNGAVLTPEGTSVAWSFSVDGGTTWIPIGMN